jgi:hypothetical protein
MRVAPDDPKKHIGFESLYDYRVVRSGRYAVYVIKFPAIAKPDG